jgi:hypothetical protein
MFSTKRRRSCQADCYNENFFVLVSDEWSKILRKGDEIKINGKNTLAYFAAASIMKQKSFIRGLFNKTDGIISY